VGAGRAADLPGAAHLTLAAGVMHLDPASAVFEGMLEGWKRQQQTRFLKWESTIKPRLSLVRRFAAFTGQYPWEWEPAEAEAFFAQIRADNPGFTMSSGRQYQNSLRMFMDFICDPRYGWLPACLERFGRAPAQILHEWNSVTHVAGFEGQPGRRPLTYDEVQALFDAADGMAEDKRARGRRGALTAMRNAALLKAFYAWGLFSGVRLLREGLASRVCAAQRLLTDKLSAAAVVVQGPARRVIGAGSCG
jgi:integrase/recombinase XerD